MSPKTSASSGVPPAGAPAAAEPRRIRRAIALAFEGESITGVSPSAGAHEAALPATPSADGGSAAAQLLSPDSTGTAQQSEPAGRGSLGGRLFPLSGRRHSPDRSAHASAADEDGLAGVLTAVGRATTATAGTASATRAPGASTGTRVGHRPLLVAAAVAGAMLVTAPFVSGRGGTTNYEGMGQSVPVATMSPDATGSNAEPDAEGNSSSMPLLDPSEGTAHPFVPQPLNTPSLPGSLTRGDGSPGPAGPVRPGSKDGSQPGSGPRVSGGLGLGGGLRLGLGLGLGLGKGGKSDPKASGPNGTLDTSRPADARRSTAGTPTTSTKVSLLSTAADPTNSRTEAMPAVKTGTKTTSAAVPTVHIVKAATPGKSAARATPTKAAKPDWGTRVIQGTTVIEPGRSVASNRMRITMGTNGNLVISDENGVIRWSSHTEGIGYKAVFQADGNFVVYTRNNSTAWSSRTDGHDGAKLVIQGDGNVTIQSADGKGLWSAGTQH